MTASATVSTGVLSIRGSVPSCARMVVMASSTGRPAGSRTPTDAILAACGYAGTPCVNSENSTEDASSILHSTGHGVTRTISLQTSSATVASVSDILRVSVSLDRSAAAKTNKSSTVSHQISSSVSDCGGTF